MLLLGLRSWKKKILGEKEGIFNTLTLALIMLLHRLKHGE
jgi:hypothetical protein